jgi:hypothetical protein
MTSAMSCITAARISRSYCDSTRCFVTIGAVRFATRPSYSRATRLLSHRSMSGTMPRRKKTHTRHIGPQKPTPGPCPTAALLKRE